MKLIIKQSELLKELKICQKIMGGTSVSPVLANILIEATEAGKVILTATDLEIFYQGVISSEVEEHGKTLIPGNNFIDIISTFSGDERLIISLEESYLVIKTDKSEYKLFCNNPEDYPTLPEKKDKLKTIEFPVELFRKAIDKTSYSVSTDTTKRELNGLLFSSDGRLLTIVATDGRRLGSVVIDFDKGIESFDNIIVPAKVLKEVSKIDTKELKINLTNTDITFVTDKAVFISRLIEGRYPNYKQVIPDGKMSTIEINKNELLKNLKGIIPIAKEISFTIKCRFEKEELVISALSSRVGRGERKMAIKNSGEPLNISYNAKYMLDCINSLDGEVIVFEPVSMVKATKILPMEQEENMEHVNILMPVRTA